jgi:hypothetical protein
MVKCLNMPASSSRPPVDLILHAAAEALHGLAMAAVKDNRPDDAAKFAATRHGFTRAIRPEGLAEEWNEDGPILEIGYWVARIVTGGDPTPQHWGGGKSDKSNSVAVARRLADTACALTVTGDSEDATQAGALWTAAGALAGLGQSAAPPTGFKVPGALELRFARERDEARSLAAARALIIDNIRTGLGFAKGDGQNILDAIATTKALADRAIANDADRRGAWAQLDAVRVALGAQEGSDLPAQARLIKARAVDNEGLLAGCAKWQAERDAIAKALGVQPNTNLAVIADDARRERDAAIEAREAMQVKLYEAERVADAAQEEARGLRAQIVNGPEEWNRAIAWAGRL